MMRQKTITVLFAFSLLIQSASAELQEQYKVDFFERKVRPLLVNKCGECHGPDLAEANLRLDSAAHLFAGGESGKVVIPFDAKASRLIQLVHGRDDLQMPPEDRLEPHEILTLEEWVQEGAYWPGYEASPKNPEKNPEQKDPLFSEEQKSFWSFQPIRNPLLPQVSDNHWPTSPVDYFILARLEEKGLTPAVPADKRTLLRRVTYDLTGLPPTPEEMKDFLADDSQHAFEKVVDRLLASPRYGEQWAQHWLDVVRFAESAGHDGNNAYLHAWRYRDYVIQSINDDKPFNQFIVEQLAGDLLPATGDPARDYEQLVATGFLQVGPKPVVMRDKRQMLLDIADEQLHTTGVAFLGLTIGCARCHDHKFDPIPTADYYSLAGIFTSTHVMADAINDSKWVEEEIPGHDGKPVKTMLVHDLPEPKNLQVHRRGNYRTLGEEVPRRFLQIIAGEDHLPIETAGSGRLELAQWIASRENPLTSRVIVNRLWQYHFGQGIVPSSGNFGLRGEAPSHPKLLDWLATRFIENGWSLKALHKMLLLSSTYQQAHVEDQQASLADPENRLLGRMPRRRLTGEQLRDTLLFLSGELDLTMGGTLFTEGYSPNDAVRELYVVDISGKETYPPFLKPRRSIYLPVIRNGRPELQTLFDSPSAHESTSVRSETTVPTQSLYLMNSPFIRNLALSFVNQITDALIADEIPEQQFMRKGIQRAYELVLGRPPTEEEIVRSEEFLDTYQQLAAKVPNPLKISTQAGGIEAYVDLIQKTEGLVFYQQYSGIEFNGRDSMIRTNLSEQHSNMPDEFSAECWIKPAAVPNFMMIVGRDGAARRLWKIGVYGLEIEEKRQNVLFTQVFDARLGGHRIIAEPQCIAPLEEWTHVLFACGNNQRRFFVNGQLVDDMKYEGRLPTGNVPLTIGARATKTEMFHGKIDHVSIYDRVLDQPTAKKHYHTFRKVLHGELVDNNVLAWQAFCQSLFCLNEFIYIE